MENSHPQSTIIGDTRTMNQNKSRRKALTKALQYVLSLCTQIRDLRDTAAERSRVESEACRHNGQPPYCLSCTSVYIRMP